MDEKNSQIVDQDGNTELMATVVLGDNDHALKLIQHGVDLDVQNQREGYSALHFAACSKKEGATELMQALVEAGAELNKKDNLGKTPFQLAIENGNLDGVAFFVSRKVDLNEEYENGKTPLSVAITAQQDKIIELLLNNGAIFSASTGEELLEFALRNKNKTLVELFFKQYNNEAPGKSYDAELFFEARKFLHPKIKQKKNTPAKIDIKNLNIETKKLLFEIVQDRASDSWRANREYILKLKHPNGEIREQHFLLSHELVRRGRKEGRQGNRIEVKDTKSLGAGAMGVVSRSIGTLVEKNDSMEFKEKQTRVIKTAKRGFRDILAQEKTMTPQAKPTASKSGAMVIPHIEGQTLKQVLEDDKKGSRLLTYDDYYQLTIGLLEDLVENITGKNIAHKDIKPDNTMVKFTGDPVRPIAVKIFDFGLAVSLDDEAGVNRWGGTPGYMAYELANSLGIKPGKGAALDVYSTGRTIQDIWEKALDDPKSSLRALKCERPIKELCRQMTHHVPGLRISAEEALSRARYEYGKFLPIFNKAQEELHQKCLKTIAEVFMNNTVVGNAIAQNYLNVWNTNMPGRDRITPELIREFGGYIVAKMRYEKYLSTVLEQTKLQQNPLINMVFHLDHKIYAENVVATKANVKAEGKLEKLTQRLPMFTRRNK